MNTFPSTIKFKYAWRSYQQTVLDQLSVFLENRHLHIVAPPGSGKTVLGLEVTIRLNKPTLILAPTLTIRDQWIVRLCELFLDTDTIPDWISTDIRNPRFLTVVTYQGLHSACGSRGDLDGVVKQLKSQEVSTLVLDEAHHLKSQWWETLNKVKKMLSPIVVGLTATPPYDSDYNEWKKYIELNGEIDMEITVPELIREGDLCPHQDYVYFSEPTDGELTKITKFRTDRKAIFEELVRNQLLRSSFCKTDIWTKPQSSLEWIYDNLPVYTSYLLLLIHNQIEIPASHIQVLGLSVKDFEKQRPEFTYQRLECILNYFLFQDQIYFTHYAEQKEEMINRLRRKGIINNNKIVLSDNTQIDRLLTSSSSKLRSIVDIAAFEQGKLGNRLRMVILSDFIRDEYLNPSEDNTQELSKIGVVSIFESLLNRNLDTEKLAVLTGSVVILPKTALPRLDQLCDERKIELSEKNYTVYRTHYLLLSPNAALKDSMVAIVTQLFTEGSIEILVGTKALLGEGWDAPAINSLILASFVGSFVLSNQMRGRAIRTERNNPSKTSTIWHLVCIDPTIDTGGHDIEILKRRFKSFVGISNTQDAYIENGLERLNILRDQYTSTEVQAVNDATLKFASNRQDLIERWRIALDSGNSMVNEIKLPYPDDNLSYQQQVNLQYRNTIAYLLAEIGLVFSVVGYFLLDYLQIGLRLHQSLRSMSYVLLATLVLGIIFFGNKTYTALRLYIMYRDIAWDFRNIADALLMTLVEERIVKTPLKYLTLDSQVDEEGTISCTLKGADRAEQTVFMDALMEILSVVENPRYIIVRHDGKARMRKDDYHAVPAIIGGKKKSASYFYSQWYKNVGYCDLIYTRTLDGRKMLLKARVDSLAAQFDKSKMPQEYRKWS